jgi:uncharacterized protein YjbI with pentapeptide repeats
MADNDHVAQLGKGPTGWNEWRAENVNVRPDLREVYVLGTNLNAVNLREADLRGAKITETNLSEASFHQADLRNANLSGSGDAS